MSQEALCSSSSITQSDRLVGKVKESFVEYMKLEWGPEGEELARGGRGEKPLGEGKAVSSNSM